LLDASKLNGKSKQVHVELDQNERRELEQLVHSGNAPARMQTRARILLLSDRSQGQKRTDQEVAAAVICSASTAASQTRLLSKRRRLPGKRGATLLVSP
jgi:hypothetical protein